MHIQKGPNGDERKRAPIRAKLGLRSAATGEDREQDVVRARLSAVRLHLPNYASTSSTSNSLHYIATSTSISRACILHYRVGFVRFTPKDVKLYDV